MGAGRWTVRPGLFLGAAALIVALGCPGGGHGNRQAKLNLTNDAGEPITSVSAYDSLMVSLSQAEPRTHYEFRVTPAGSASPIVGQARLSTDQKGDLPPALLLFDVGQGNVPIGSYDVAVSGPGVNETVTIDVDAPKVPYVFTCDSTGAVKNTFDYGDPLYAAGGNFPPNTEVHLTPLVDRTEYNEGDDVSDGSGMPPNPGGTQGRYATIVFTDANGEIPITELVNFFFFGIEGDGYDIVADLDPFGEFNEGQDAVDGEAVVGATFQIPDVGTDVDSQLACQQDGTYRDNFGTDEDIYVKINPPLKYVIQAGWVDKYVCNHKNEWQDGDPLQDVSGGDEMDGVQSGCTNEPIVIIFPGPIPPGDYDVIIDIDKDGVYTQGIDIVDGGSAESLGKIGFTVN